MKGPQQIMLDREWNNAQYFNMTILVLTHSLWGDIHKYTRKPSPDLYESLRSQMLSLIGYLYNTPRIEIDELEKIEDSILAIEGDNIRELREIAKEIGKLVRAAKIMDFRGKSIYSNEVLSQAMK